MKERTGIFGGAFNPVHNGHLAVAASFLKSHMIHQLLVIPTPDPPHKKGEKMAPFHHRLQMLQMAFKGVNGVSVSDLETRLASPSYTLWTLQHLRSTHPESLFYLCIGGDSLRQFENWYGYEEILQQTVLLVAARPDYNTRNLSASLRERVIFVEHNPIDFSSTHVRNLLSLNEKSLYQIPESVERYIYANNLYSD